MKYLDWDEAKNAQLRLERDVSFEDVVTAIDDNRLLDTVVHPNQKRYPGQKFYIIEIERYAYLVPYVEDEQKIFLKTIIPSRKATKKYIINKK
ncbi:MAG: BrnT family toxin [Candidatus Berkelbacteria bacterium]|nr:BrnT family toxin [Candidatus Berkelbacteria bacterium]MCR4306934.1 BrnT family toxin [Candidatus Berkelbacteria bacterium]